MIIDDAVLPMPDRKHPHLNICGREQPVSNNRIRYRDFPVPGIDYI
jgi:hypothetical protein